MTKGCREDRAMPRLTTVDKARSIGVFEARPSHPSGTRALKVIMVSINDML